MAGSREEDDTASAECPVLAAWRKSDTMMLRLTQTSLIQIPPKTVKLSRDNLSENVDFLAPLINHYGL